MNHDYQTPSKGTENWHTPLNANFEKLDQDVEIRDADGNKSQYEPRKGAKFVATDTKTVYLGDGSQWQQFATLGAGFDGTVHVQSSKPENASEGDLWVQIPE
ncbi:hypothetical protein [Halorussus litoreus]|uniref:hypothetical protein n=1 Tax=Halorussus litoreus TaxID=1710536 RepID=UPI000E250103|nr:hypothetical protein [Halorussus litoreus]